jgi:hypothetical protein
MVLAFLMFGGLWGLRIVLGDDVDPLGDRPCADCDSREFDTAGHVLTFTNEF